MTSKPNILLLMTDQQRADSLGSVSPWASTPNIDRIAAEGVRFDSAVTNSPVCMPARLALALGQYPHNFGLWRNGRFSISEGRRIWVNDVRDAGYHTALIGKHHLEGGRPITHVREREPYLHRLGFDYVHEVLDARGSANTESYLTDKWKEAGVYQATVDDTAHRWQNNGCAVYPSPLPLELYYDTYVGQQAKAHIAGLPANQPWFCKVSFPGPHEPWDTPEPYASQFDPADMAPSLPQSDLGDAPPSSLNGWFERSPYITRYGHSVMRANYAAGVKLIDDQIGEILDEVERRGEMDNTVIIVTSDHGEMNGDHRLVYKNNFLDGALLIPLVLRAPDVAQRGSSSEALVELLDVGKTIADYAGAKLTTRHFGISLRDIVDGTRENTRGFVISQYRGETMIMTSRYKLMVNEVGENSVLFDRLHDPDEQRNLIGRPGGDEPAARLRSHLVGFFIRRRSEFADSSPRPARNQANG